jgi:aspartyl aminopeptidase
MMDGELAFLITHYYGGIKNYQWLAKPMELHGVVVLKRTGSAVQISIGTLPPNLTCNHRPAAAP